MAANEIGQRLALLLSDGDGALFYKNEPVHLDEKTRLALGIPSVGLFGTVPTGGNE